MVMLQFSFGSYVDGKFGVVTQVPLVSSKHDPLAMLKASLIVLMLWPELLGCREDRSQYLYWEYRKQFQLTPSLSSHSDALAIIKSKHPLDVGAAVGAIVGAAVGAGVG